MKSAIAAAAMAITLAIAPIATAAQTPDQIMRQLAANQTHSWVDDGIGYPAMLERYRDGQRLFITCGHIAEIARVVLRQAGYEARVVQAITRGEFDFFNDGHLMNEVLEDGRWQLYDLDANVRAVDDSGHGVSLVEQVAAVQQERARWEVIADDPLYLQDEPDETLRDLARRIFTDPAAFYRRVMGDALLPRDPEGTKSRGMYFKDADQATRLRAYNGGWLLASEATWLALTSAVPQVPTSGQSPAPTPVAVVAPAPPQTAQPPAPVAHQARQRRCRLRGLRVHHRQVSCRDARRTLRSYVRDDHAPRRWRCRTRADGRAVCSRNQGRARALVAMAGRAGRPAP